MTDEMLDKLGNLYVYYEIKEITFEQFVHAYQRGDDLSDLISAVKERT